MIQPRIKQANEKQHQIIVWEAPALGCEGITLPAAHL